MTESLCCSSGTGKPVGVDGKINGGKHWAIPEEKLSYIYLPAGQIPQRGTSNTMYLLRSKQIAILEWPSQSLDESNQEAIARLEMCRHKHSPFTVTNVGFYSKKWAKMENHAEINRRKVITVFITAKHGFINIVFVFLTKSKYNMLNFMVDMWQNAISKALSGQNSLYFAAFLASLRLRFSLLGVNVRWERQP